jgi:hypothetical protein
MVYRLSSDVKIVGEDQLVMMDVRQGKYYSCNRIAAMIVRGLARGEALEAITQNVEMKFSQTDSGIKADILRFLEKLVLVKLCHVANY